MRTVGASTAWRALLFCALALLPAGCSRSTVATIRVDLLSFIPEAALSGSLTVSESELLLPDADGVASGELGLPEEALGSLQSFETSLAGALTLRAGGGAEIRLGVYMAGGGSPFAAAPVAEKVVALRPGEPVPVSLDVEISEAERAAVLEAIRQGDFRLGVRLSWTGAAGEVEYRLTRLEASASWRAGRFFPF